ncbi:MAG: ATP-binding protein [Candidatus Micrarchaeaceae archaeon]
MMDINLADGVDIDAQAVVTGRGCAIGQSGSGKSYLAGVIAEDLCKARMPFCVIDTEGEYGALKKIFNIIVVGGENKDIDIDVDFHDLFEASIANGIPVVLDLSDSVDKASVANSALEALYNIEDRKRSPYLVIIEEADIFAPQIVSSKYNIVEEISVRGRKRGIGLFITTQRPAKISKNVLAQCSYGFVGKLTIENDLNAIRILFEDRSRLVLVTRLKIGEFVPFGTVREQKFKVKGRISQHSGETPSIGNVAQKDDKKGSILGRLREHETTEAKAPKSINIQTIDALHMTFDKEAATRYAERIMKRKFIIFGNATEKIGAVELKYLPFGLCRIRIPTSHRNEYLEYMCLFNQRYELAKIEKQIRYLTAVDIARRPKNNYNEYLIKGSLSVDKIKTPREDIINGTIDTKRIKNSIMKFFHSAVLTDFSIVYVPIYGITLREGNRIRVFTIDGLHGQPIAL